MKLIKAFIFLLIILTSGMIPKSHAQFRSGQTITFISVAGEKDLALAPQDAATAQRTPIVVHSRTGRYEAASKWRLESAGGGWFSFGI